MAGSQSQTQTNNSSVDPQTKAYIEAYRQRAQGQTGYQTGLQGLDAYLNPYQSQVVGGVQSDFDRQRALAQNAAADQATRAGAFGGSREAVLRANALNDVNRNETGTLADLRYQGFNDAAGRLIGERQFGANNALAQLNALTPGFQPTSQTNTQTLTQKTPFLPQLLGFGAQVAGGFLGGGPAGAGMAAASYSPSSIQSAAPFIQQSNPLNFGNYGGGYSFDGQGGWNPQVIRRNPWGGY